MITSINPYFGFNGNCSEAMHFYRDCLGGELILQTIGESPMAERMPAAMKDKIMHAQLKNGDMVLMGSDLYYDSAMIKGNNVTTVLHFDDEAGIRSVYDQLSAGGKALHPLENTFWSALFGDLIDRYGNYWMLNHLSGENKL